MIAASSGEDADEHNVMSRLAVDYLSSCFVGGCRDNWRSIFVLARAPSSGVGKSKTALAASRAGSRQNYKTAALPTELRWRIDSHWVACYR